MPRRKSEYLSGRGFSMYIDLKDSLPDIYEALPQASVDALKTVAESARAAHESETPMKTGRLRNDTQVVGYVNGSLGGTVYVRWLAQNPKDNYRYAYAQEQGQVGDRYYVSYTTPGTGPGFMKATWQTIKETMSSGVADAVEGLIKKNEV